MSPNDPPSLANDSTRPEAQHQQIPEAVALDHLSETQHVAAVSRQIKPPPFCKQNPRLWFAQVEMAFLTNGITTDVNKFRFVALHLSGDVLDAVSDIILTPPTEGKYEVLKRRIVATYDEGDERRLRRLLRPILRTLFLEQLPDQVRAILVASDTQDLTRLAEMADRAVDAVRPTSVNAVAILNETRSNIESQDKSNDLQFSIHALQLQVEALTKQFNWEFRPRRGRSRSRGPGPRGRSPVPANKDRNSNLPCYYHKRFGSDARNCQAPCGWPKSQTNPEKGN